MHHSSAPVIFDGGALGVFHQTLCLSNRNDFAKFLKIVACVLIGFWSILYIGGRKNQMIMQDGPYSMCRHPLYLFSTIGVFGFGLAFIPMIELIKGFGTHYDLPFLALF